MGERQGERGVSREKWLLPLSPPSLRYSLDKYLLLESTENNIGLVLVGHHH